MNDTNSKARVNHYMTNQMNAGQSHNAQFTPSYAVNKVASHNKMADMMIAPHVIASSPTLSLQPTPAQLQVMTLQSQAQSHM